MPETTESKDERCECGKLLLKKTDKGFEFKCNRCKRIHVIPFNQINPEFQHLCPIEDSDK